MMIEFKYDTQLLIEGENLKKEEISKHINKNLKGDCLIVVLKVSDKEIRMGDHDD